MQIDTSKKTIITAKEVSTKFRSKNEIYRFMTVDVGAYLPPKECVTIYWLKELARGHKKCKLSSHSSNYRCRHKN